MNKKRGVVVSSSNHPKTISKSKSAHTHPLPLQQNHNQLASRSGAIPPLENEELAQSNLLSEEPERMINQAYYTYQEPESNHHHDYDKYEENEEYVIQSMQRRKELKEHERREQEKRKIAEKARAAAEVAQKLKKDKEAKDAKLKSSGRGKTTTIKSLGETVPRGKKTKCRMVECAPAGREEVRRDTITVSTKPKPLEFSVNMLDKMYMHSPHRKKEEVLSLRVDRIDYERTSLTVRNTINEDSSHPGENFNCKRLPFRFQPIY